MHGQNLACACAYFRPLVVSKACIERFGVPPLNVVSHQTMAHWKVMLNFARDMGLHWGIFRVVASNLQTSLRRGFWRKPLQRGLIGIPPKVAISELGQGNTPKNWRNI